MPLGIKASLCALRLTWTGIIAGTDGGVDWRKECMGAGYVTGTESEVETALSARVGVPLSSLRAEAASLLQLLIDLRDRSSTALLVFVDSLVLLDILQRWGQVSFHPHPTDVIHFDVSFPLLAAGRAPAVAWPGAAGEGEAPYWMPVKREGR